MMKHLSKLVRWRGRLHALTLCRRTGTVTNDYFKKCLDEICAMGSSYGFHGNKFQDLKSEKIIVEYSSPNIAKKFHAGHFRSTIVGQAISNIIEKAGHEVVRLNYLGDWGIQFAVLAIGFEKYGDPDSFAQNPLAHLYEVYVKASEDLENDDSIKQTAHRIFHSMEQGEPDALEFWQKCRSVSLQEFVKLYKTIGVSFDDYESESMYRESSQALLKDLRGRGLLEKFGKGNEGMDLASTGSSWVSEQNAPPYACLARADGTSLYLTRDVAAAMNRRRNYGFDKMYYVTDSSQRSHFQQVFSTLEAIGEGWARQETGTLHHLTFGRIQGMKTRRGEVVFFEDILNEVTELTGQQRLEHATRKDIANEQSMLTTLGMSGLICNDLKSKLAKSYRFSWETALQSKGHTGIFLQYTHSRLQSLKENCGVELVFDVDCTGLCNSPSAVSLMQHMETCSDTMWDAYTDLEPCYITRYMFELAHRVAICMRKLPVKGQALSVAQPRLLLFHCAQVIVHNCMTTIGMQPLEKM